MLNNYETDITIPFDHHTLSRAEESYNFSEIAQNKYNENEVTAFVISISNEEYYTC